MAKEILIIKHIDIEGPGSIADFFGSTTWEMRTVDLSKGERLPRELEGIGAIVSLGGPMNVYEEEKYPFLKEEDEFLKAALREKIPILGICLGAQLLAKACGAQVKKGIGKEVGWHRVSLTEPAKQDSLFKALPNELLVFQWHEDTFEIPAEATLLATSAICVNQAFRFGSNAYGLQFHIEVTPQMIEEWMIKYNNTDKDTLLRSYKIEREYYRQAESVYLNFSRVIKNNYGG